MRVPESARARSCVWVARPAEPARLRGRRRRRVRTRPPRRGRTLWRSARLARRARRLAAGAHGKRRRGAGTSRGGADARAPRRWHVALGANDGGALPGNSPPRRRCPRSGTWRRHSQTRGRNWIAPEPRRGASRRSRRPPALRWPGAHAAPGQGRCRHVRRTATPPTRAPIIRLARLRRRGPAHRGQRRGASRPDSRGARGRRRRRVVAAGLAAPGSSCDWGLGAPAPPARAGRHAGLRVGRDGAHLARARTRSGSGAAAVGLRGRRARTSSAHP